MHDSMTIAVVGSIVNVIGSRIATPFGPPSPGSTPTKMPSTSPSSIIARIFHVSSTAKPCSRRLTGFHQSGATITGRTALRSAPSA
jgi:hypothetical protein